jgi:hypothetical protein
MLLWKTEGGRSFHSFVSEYFPTFRMAWLQLHFRVSPYQQGLSVTVESVQGLNLSTNLVMVRFIRESIQL